MRDILWVDCEAGQLGIIDNPRIADDGHLTNNRVAVTSFKQVSDVHDWLVGHCLYRDLTDARSADVLRTQEARLRGCDPKDIAEPARFRTVILDSISEIDTLSNYELLGVSEARILSGDSENVEVATWDEFRKNNMRIQMLLRAFRNLPMHLLVTSAAHYKEDELKKRHWEPALTGQLTRQVQGFFDIVGYLQVSQQADKVEYRLNVQPGTVFYAKNRRATYTKSHFTDPFMKTILEGVGLLKPA